MSTLRRTVGGAWILLHTRGQQRHCSNVSGFLRVYLGTVRGKLFGSGGETRSSIAKTTHQAFFYTQPVWPLNGRHDFFLNQNCAVPPHV